MELPKQYLAREVEARWKARWLEMDLYRWDASRPREETFVMDSPPPTASGSLHMGHVFSYTHQDVIMRQRRMRGFNVFYPMGWDDNGLPTERRVQNYFNVRCDAYVPFKPGFVPKNEKKAPPEVIGRPNFIELCKEVTLADEQVFKDLFQTLGLSIDWNLEYATIDESSRRTSQLSFLKLLEEGHAYQVESPTMWDVDFQTAVAQAEVVDKMLPGAFHHVRFGVEGGGSLVIATTRPELIPACVAILAHPDDVRYQALFGKTAITPLFRVPVPILPHKAANPEKGTGILMVCTFGDATDVEWWREFGLPTRQIIGRDGRLLPVDYGQPGWESLDAEAANAFYAELKGKTVKQAKAAIVEMLRRETAEALPGLGVPLTEEPKPIEHAVKLYEKGDRPLELITTRQWFVRLLDKKEVLIEQGKKIEWRPSFMLSRYVNWVDGLNQDWCISRQRYFGVPFPVWYPLDGQGQPEYDRPIVPQVKNLPVDPLSMPAPGYDESQRGQPNGFIGDPDVMDTWATSSLTPQISSHWATDPVRHSRLFPADLRPQSHEIIRTWAFYTIVKAWLHDKTVPWHNVMISGWILDPDRKKMSKSAGNVVTPQHLLEQYSSDAIRYWAARARLGVDTAFDESLFAIGKKLTTKLFNATRFVAGHLLSFNLSEFGAADVTEPLDQGYLHALGGVVARASAEFEQYEYAAALSEIEAFFWADTCDNYLELVKSRAYEEGMSAGKRSALATLKQALSVTLRLLAPFLPFMTEELWSWLFATPDGATRSVHTAPWPSADEFAVVGMPNGDPYGAALEVLKEVRRTKGEARVSMKTPVVRLEVRGSAEELSSLRQSLGDVLAVSAATGAELIEAEVSGRFEVKVELQATEKAT